MKTISLVNQLLEKDDYELLLWLRWLAEKKISCIECVKTRAAMSKIKPDCSLCLPISTQITKYFSGGKPNEKDQRIKD
jgi:hypothetical protein